MKTRITLLLLMTILAASCKKTTNVEVNFNTTGNLEYKLVDDNGNGIPNMKVLLYDNVNNFNNYNYVYNTTLLLDSKLTDQNGLVKFEDLNASTYTVIPDSAKVNNISYSIRENIQVAAGKTKQRTTKVTDFTGTLNLTITYYSYYPNNATGPYANLGVLLIPITRMTNSSAPIANLMTIADFKGTTSATGQLSFKIPSNVSYYVVVYNSSTNTILSNYGSVLVEKDAVRPYPLTIYRN